MHDTNSVAFLLENSDHKWQSRSVYNSETANALASIYAIIIGNVFAAVPCKVQLYKIQPVSTTHAMFVEQPEYHTSDPLTFGAL